MSPSSSPRAAAAAARGLPAPWANVVRGDSDAAPSSSSSPPPPPMTSDIFPPPNLTAAESGACSSSSDGDAAAAAAEILELVSNGIARGKKPAWNVPSNGNGTAVEVGPVMGAVSWPALSESTKVATAKSSASASSDSSKFLTDDSISAPQGPAIASPQPHANASSLNSSSIPNHNATTRQKANPNSNSLKRGGGGGASSSSSTNGGSGPLSLRPPPPTFVETRPVSSEKGSESSTKDLANKGNNNWDHHRPSGFGPQPHSGGDNHRRFGGNRRGNNGRGGGGGYGSRRDHERGGYDWNAPRGFNGRDPHVPVLLPQQRSHSRPFIRPPPPVPAPFISTPMQVRPFVGPLGFPEIPPVYYVPAPPSLEPMRSVPFAPHQMPAAIPPGVFLAPADQQRTTLLKQIEYYFSPENLCKDIFLRQNMDDQGWVPLSLIAGFNRVKKLTNSIPYILDSVRSSTVVEVQAEKIRKRADWMNWILPPTPNQYGLLTQTLPTTEYDALAKHVYNLELEEGASKKNARSQTYTVLSRSASDNLLQDGDPTGEGFVQVSGKTESDRSKSMKSFRKE